jgi:hypothetical protein
MAPPTAPEKSTARDIVNLYRSLLEPMGFNVVAKEKKEEGWKPADWQKYDKMNSVDLDKQMANLKSALQNQEKQMLEIRDKAAKYMETRPMNDFTKTLYIGPGQIEKRMIILSSKSYDDMLQLYGYLENVRQQKWKSEILEGLQEKQPGVTGVDMVREASVGAPQLKIFLK